MWFLWLRFDYGYRKIKYIMGKKGQITPNIELNHVLILVHWVAQCSKITNTVLLLKHIFHDFSAFEQLSISNVRMSEGTFCHVEVYIQHLGNYVREKVYPYKPHFYIETKLGLKGFSYFFFLFLIRNIDAGYLASTWRFLRVPTIDGFTKNVKNIMFLFRLKIFNFTALENFIWACFHNAQ